LVSYNQDQHVDVFPLILNILIMLAVVACCAKPAAEAGQATHDLCLDQ
jgi:hypothetical protein